MKAIYFLSIFSLQKMHLFLYFFLWLPDPEKSIQIPPAAYSWLANVNFKKVLEPSFLITFICNALRDLVPFVQFKKREKHPWRSVTIRKAAG